MDLSNTNKKIHNINRKDIEFELSENNVNSHPFVQFVDWFDKALMSETYDPSAMVLATVDEKGNPDARVVLLKELSDYHLIFYTNYNSNKARQLAQHDIAALNFYWPSLARQVRVRGRVIKIDRQKSESYFATRPREAQIGAHASHQSTVIQSRVDLDNKVKQISEKFLNKQIPCPKDWGGYELIPFEYEFFQGKKWRVHDRLLYTLKDDEWKLVRLAP
jgi:pyridoxamine 5'-phosphate oxidase